VIETLASLSELLPSLLQGLRLSLQIAVCGIALAIPCALIAGLGRRAQWAPLRWLALAYIEVFRGTSALVQLFWFYFALPLVGIEFSPFLTAVLVLGLNAGAYGAEVVRGALQTVPRGQWEAARVLGLTPRQTLWRVILPQTLLPILPPATNLSIELLKNTALVSMITLSDLTFSAQVLRAETLRTVEIYLIVLLLYFAAARLISLAAAELERWLAVGQDHGGVR
jgi:polar amino acid transport system permease protein